MNRTGRPGLLTAINFDTWNTRSIRCPTSFGANIQLHDYTGRHADIWTDFDGFASFRIPSNAFSSGQSYLCFSLAGVNFAAGITGRPTTRTIFGSNDLDAPPAKNSQVTVGRISAEKGSPISLQISVDWNGWRAASAVDFLVADERGRTVIEGSCAGDHAAARGIAGDAGEYRIFVAGRQLPENGSSFEMDITYTAPKTL